MMFEYVTAAPTPTAESGKTPQVDKPSSHCSCLFARMAHMQDLSDQPSLYPAIRVARLHPPVRQRGVQEVEMRLTDNSRALPRQDDGTSSTSSSSVLQVLFWQED